MIQFPLYKARRARPPSREAGETFVGSPFKWPTRLRGPPLVKLDYGHIAARKWDRINSNVLRMSNLLEL
jgi:hypothetical protein